MKFENTQVMNFKGALRGMRNPKNSWNKSDSVFGLVNTEWDTSDFEVAELWANKFFEDTQPEGFDTTSKEYEDKVTHFDEWLIKNGILQMDEEIAEIAFIGPADMKLAQTLTNAGPEHRKFLRQIFVSVDITAPLYWWKEMDTYKVATVANSTSSMHTLVNSPITFDKFEIDDYIEDIELYPANDFQGAYTSKDAWNDIITHCETLRQKYVETKDERYWKELVRILPEGWLQTRTWTANYETIKAICSKGQRRNHKLNEWSGKHTSVDQSFIQWARTLPYAKEFIFIDEY